jgi:hypothetical protein
MNESFSSEDVDSSFDYALVLILMSFIRLIKIFLGGLFHVEREIFCVFL